MMYESSQQDSNQRPFICPCGKSYLSYPALFTHVKQKHDGNAPGQLVRPKSVNKRGRPRKTPSELPNPLLPPLPDYKNFANRLLLSRLDSQSEFSGSRDAVLSRHRARGGSDFIPPIPPSHLSLIKTFHALPRPTPAQRFEPSQRFQAPKDSSIPTALLVKLKGVFAPLSSGNYLNTANLERLIKMNQCYQRARGRERKRLRRVLGKEGLEMELRQAVLEFLEAAEDELTKREFKNLEVLMGLMLVFYLDMLENGQAVTTQNYVQHINSFTKHLLQEAYREHRFQQIFSLQKHIAMQLLEVFHQWLLLQKLTQHELQINPLFAVTDPPEKSCQKIQQNIEQVPNKQSQEALKSENQRN